MKPVKTWRKYCGMKITSIKECSRSNYHHHRLSQLEASFYDEPKPLKSHVHLELMLFSLFFSYSEPSFLNLVNIFLWLRFPCKKEMKIKCFIILVYQFSQKLKLLKDGSIIILFYNTYLTLISFFLSLSVILYYFTSSINNTKFWHISVMLKPLRNKWKWFCALEII